MFTATIHTEDLDVDYTYGEMDGHTTRTTWVVTYFENGIRKTEGCYKTEEYATRTKEAYESGNFGIGEYGEIRFPWE